MNLKESSKKYKKKYKCSWCKFTSNKDCEIKEHEKWLHGDYGAHDRIKKKKYEIKYPKPEESMKELYGKMKTKDGYPIDVMYKWYKGIGYKIFTDTIYGNDIEVIWDNDKSMYKLKNFESIKKEYERRKAEGIID